MRIPSIYLPIDIELFDGHFQRFFEDFTAIRPDYLKYTLNQIKIGTDRIRYEIEFENLKQSNPVESKRVISQIEAFKVVDHKIEIRAAALEINKSGSGEVFLGEFYKMIYIKWNVKPFFPNVEDSEDVIMNSAQVQLDHDYGISKILDRKVPFSDPNKENDIVNENTELLPTIDDDEIIRRLEGFDNALQQGLPPIDAIHEDSQKSSKRGPLTPPDEEKLKALSDWDNKKGHDQYLVVFLKKRFGTEGGVLKVAPSTFHEWRIKLRKKGLLDSK